MRYSARTIGGANKGGLSPTDSTGEYPLAMLSVWATLVFATKWANPTDNSRTSLALQ